MGTLKHRVLELGVELGVQSVRVRVGARLIGLRRASDTSAFVDVLEPTDATTDENVVVEVVPNGGAVVSQHVEKLLGMLTLPTQNENGGDAVYLVFEGARSNA